MVEILPDHIGGHFEWDRPPQCRCGLLKKAIEEELFIFVSNIVGDGYNKCYLVPQDAEGNLRSDGVTIEHCPWCGDPIQVKKKYK